MIRINLLPVRAARKKENIRRQVSVFSLSVFLLLVIMAYVSIDLGRDISDLNAKTKDAQKELAGLEAINKKVNELKKKLNKVKAKMEIIKKLEADRSGPVRIMDALTSVVVAEKMWLTSLTESNGKINLAGVAMDNKTIADFMKRLEGSPCFGMVDLISSKQVRLGEGRKFKGFSITCQALSSKPLKKLQT